MRQATLALVVAMIAPLSHAAPPSDADMELHRQKAAMWSANGLSCDQVMANLRGWFGHLFSGETNIAEGTCDIFVVTWQWRSETQREELVHRFRVITVPIEPKN